MQEIPSSIPGPGRSARAGIGSLLWYSWASLVAQKVKNLPAMQETWVRSLGWEEGHGSFGDFAAAVFISLTNPYSVAFWMGLGGAVSLIGGERPLVAQYAAFLGAFMLGATL